MSKMWESILNIFNYIGDNSGRHQIPERSFTVKGYTFPICARCTGVFIGQVICIIILALHNPLPLYVSIAFSLVMLIDWYIQHIGLKESTNIRRFITGIFGGLGCWSIAFFFISKVFSVFIS